MYDLWEKMKHCKLPEIFLKKQQYVSPCYPINVEESYPIQKRLNWKKANISKAYLPFLLFGFKECYRLWKLNRNNSYSQNHKTAEG